MSSHYDQFCELYGVEPECQDCKHFILNNHCALDDCRIDCDGISEFATCDLITYPNDLICNVNEDNIE